MGITLEALMDLEFARKLLAMSEDELWQQLGLELDIGVGAFPGTPADLIDDAKRWWKKSQDKIVHLVCSSAKVRNAVAATDDIALYTAVVDAILGVLTGVAVATAGALIVKRGVELMCKDSWATCPPGPPDVAKD